MTTSTFRSVADPAGSPAPRHNRPCQRRFGPLQTAGLPIAAAALLATAPVALAQDKSQCQFSLVAQLPLNYTGPALEVTTGGTINGTPATLLVDTGADDTYLTKTGTDKRGLKLNRTSAYGRGVGGTFNVFWATVHEIALGPIHTGRLDLNVIGNTGYAPSYDALLGASFLFQTDVEVSLPDKQLRFFKASGCGDEFLGYWKEGAVDLPFNYDPKRQPKPVFKVALNGQTMSAIIDTGSSVSIIDVDAARRAGFRPDAPGVSKAGFVAGVGNGKAPRWNAPFDSLAVGEEKINNVRLGVVDSKGEQEEDIILGADFLRTHRVLFAMGQKKLYVSYAGGDVFGQGDSADAWIRREADAGNPDAEFVLAEAYGRGGAKEAARQWLDKATSHGQPQANLQTGRRLFGEAKFADAAASLRLGLDKIPSERYGALWLYLARLQTGQPDLAKRELEATFAHDEPDEWPVPIADFYLGRIDAAALLERAGKGPSQPRPPLCTANIWIGKLYAVQGKKEMAEAASSRARTLCQVAPPPG